VDFCVPAQLCVPEESLAGESAGARRSFARLFEQLDGQGFALPIGERDLWAVNGEGSLRALAGGAKHVTPIDELLSDEYLELTQKSQ
jgi:hypothetical protein